MFIVFVLIFTLSGCTNLLNKGGTGNDKLGLNTTPVPIDPYEQADEVEITLYYKHEVSDYLVPEKRTVIREKKTIEQLIIEELLKGPQDFERLLVMPPGTELIDVTRRGDTVFVNLTDDFLNPIDLSTIPGKGNVPEDEVTEVQSEMKRLSVYSIVNSLTYMDDINEVKLLINNTQLSYSKMGLEILIENNNNIDIDTPMVSLRRNKNMILTPAKTVGLIMSSLTGVPNWDSVYLLLSNKTMEGSDIPPLDEFKPKMPQVTGGMVSYEESPIIDEEILDNKAFVTVQYIDKTVDKTADQGTEVREVITVDYIDGIWKARLPELLSLYLK